MFCTHNCTWAEISRDLFVLQDLHTAICEKEHYRLELWADFGSRDSPSAIELEESPLCRRLIEPEPESSISDFPEFSKILEQS